VTDNFAKDYAERGMLAYVEGIQRKERQNKVETLTHQKWSGAEYYDNLSKFSKAGFIVCSENGSGRCHVHGSFRKGKK
jgi:isocitrate lyase